MNDFFEGKATLGIIDDGRGDSFEVYVCDSFGFGKPGCMSAVFSVYEVRPGIGEREAYDFLFDRYDSLLDDTDSSYKFELRERFNCTPRDLTDKVVNEIVDEHGGVFEALRDELESCDPFEEGEPILELVGGGQADGFDAITYPVADGGLIADVRDLWRAYHLNDMQPGTPKQMEALEKAGLRNSGAGYDAQVQYLQAVGLYEDEWGGQPYRYGSGWLKFDIPSDDTKRIAQTADALGSLKSPMRVAKDYIAVRNQ